MFDIESLSACIRVYIEAYEIVPNAHWFGIDSLRACVRVYIEAYKIVPMFGIDSLRVVPGLIQV